MKFNKKWVVISVVVILLIVMVFFRREGYELTDYERNIYSNILKSNRLTPEEQTLFFTSIDKTPVKNDPNSIPVEFREKLMRLVSKYPTLGNQLDAAASRLGFSKNPMRPTPNSAIPDPGTMTDFKCNMNTDRDGAFACYPVRRR